MYTFPIVEKKLNSIVNIEHIHPRKQRIVGEILKRIPVFSVFGSSIRWDCNEKSDLDLLIDEKDISISKDKVFTALVKIIDSDFDLVWKGEIENNNNKYQINNILNGSIKVYGR